MYIIQILDSPIETLDSPMETLDSPIETLDSPIYESAYSAYFPYAVALRPRQTNPPDNAFLIQSRLRHTQCSICTYSSTGSLPYSAGIRTPHFAGKNPRSPDHDGRPTLMPSEVVPLEERDAP